ATPAIVERLWRLVQDCGAEDRILVASFPLAPLARFRRLSGGRIVTAGTMPEIRAFVCAAYARQARYLRPAYDVLQVPEVNRGIRVASRTTLAAAHALGLPVHVWTVDDRQSMERLLALGVDGLMSDRPDVLADVLAGHGRPRPDCV